MATFNVPTKSEVTENNQAIFNQLEKQIGFVPNLYATFAHSEHALKDYLAYQGRKSSLRGKEKEVINLVVSQVNECAYCLAAHTAMAKGHKFTDEQILEIRTGRATFDAKLDALARFARQVALERGKVSEVYTDALLEAGYTKGNIVDIITGIGDKIISNYLHNITAIPVDFPAAPAIETTNI